MDTVTGIAIPLLGAAIALCLYRILRGPSIPDRVVGLDAAGIMTMGIMLLLGIRYDEALYLDLALIIAVLSVVGTVSLAKFLMRGKIIDD
jgi:multisubunit Na+/H+ antiporter MnhF subunit